MRFFAENFFDPTIFSAGNRQTRKKFRPNIRNIQNLGQKNFHGHPIKIEGKNQKNRRTVRQKHQKRPGAIYLVKFAQNLLEIT